MSGWLHGLPVGSGTLVAGRTGQIRWKLVPAGDANTEPSPHH